MVQVGVESENGWRPAKVGADACEWVTIPGANVTLQIQRGWPLAIMRAFAADFHAYVEPLRDADSACWTPTNSVATSNHLNGTAMDLNWNSHPFHVRGTFNAAQMAVLRELLAFYEDTIFWGGDWSDPIDEMHFQMGYDTWNNPHTADFVARKIRADGYSTFRRGNIVPANDPIRVLADATGLSLGRAAQIIDPVRAGLAASECTNPLRIAMWLAQIGHEGDSFNATEEYDKGDGGATERWKYLGRTWIQITWLSNYLGFSRWCFERGLVPTPTYFGDRPRELADLKWAGLGPAWYWTVARPDINALCDARDIVAVTQRINGGQNGIADRRARYQRALAVGDALMALTSTQNGDDMANVPQDQWDAVFRELTQSHESLSGYRTPGEGKVGTWCRIDRNKDLMIHEFFVEWSAIQYGTVDDIYRLTRSAAGMGADTSPGFIARATMALSKVPKEYLNPAFAWISANDPAVLQQFINSQKGSQK